jgi:hypothetical protein
MSAQGAETILLTIFLRHDQSKNLDSIQGHLAGTGWWERFPPKGVEIVSWNVVMGIGQIVTLRLPPHLLNVGECGDRALRLGRLLDRVLPDL